MEIIEMKEIAVYGAGGLGRETVCLLQKINSQQKNWDFIGFFDDGQPVGTLNEYGRVLGGICELNAWKKELNVACSGKKIIPSIRSGCLRLASCITDRTILNGHDFILKGHWRNSRNHSYCREPIFCWRSFVKKAGSLNRQLIITGNPLWSFRPNRF